MPSGFFQSVATFAKKQLASAKVSSRKRDLKAAEEKLSSLLYATYSSEYPVNLFLAPMGVVVDKINERLYSTAFRDWKRHDPVGPPDGTMVEYELTRSYSETFHIGQLGSEFRSISRAGGIKEGLLAGNGETEAVSVDYEFLFKVVVTALQTRGTLVSAVATELIDPKNRCKCLANRHFAAPSRMYREVGGDVDHDLLLLLNSTIKQDGRPSLETWSAEATKRPEFDSAKNAIALAREKLAEAEAALAAFK